MFERFTDRARRVVTFSQEAARKLNDENIGPQHLLLGMIQEEYGPAAIALTNLGVTEKRTIEYIRKYSPVVARKVEGHLPFTPEAKKVLELALREALQLGHNYIGTEHLLLGIDRTVFNGGELADQTICEVVLRELDIRPGDLRAAVLQILRQQAGEATVGKDPEEELEDSKDYAIEQQNIPASLVRNAIVACISWLNQLPERERNSVLAFLKTWYN